MRLELLEGWRGGRDVTLGGVLMVVLLYTYSVLAWLVSVTILCVGVFFSLVFQGWKSFYKRIGNCSVPGAGRVLN